MRFISGKQVPMKQDPSDNIKQTLLARIDWDYEFGVWCTITDVCNDVGIHPSHKNLIAVGAAIREIMPNVLTRRSKSKKLILIPCKINDA